MLAYRLNAARLMGPSRTLGACCRHVPRRCFFGLSFSLPARTGPCTLFAPKVSSSIGATRLESSRLITRHSRNAVRWHAAGRRPRGRKVTQNSTCCFRTPSRFIDPSVYAGGIDQPLSHGAMRRSPALRTKTSSPTMISSSPEVT